MLVQHCKGDYCTVSIWLRPWNSQRYHKELVPTNIFTHLSCRFTNSFHCWSEIRSQLLVLKSTRIVLYCVDLVAALNRWTIPRRTCPHEHIYVQLVHIYEYFSRWERNKVAIVSSELNKASTVPFGGAVAWNHTAIQQSTCPWKHILAQLMQIFQSFPPSGRDKVAIVSSELHKASIVRFPCGCRTDSVNDIIKSLSPQTYLFTAHATLPILSKIETEESRNREFWVVQVEHCTFWCCWGVESVNKIVQCLSRWSSLRTSGTSLPIIYILRDWGEKQLLDLIGTRRVLHLFGVDPWQNRSTKPWRACLHKHNATDTNQSHISDDCCIGQDNVVVGVDSTSGRSSYHCRWWAVWSSPPCQQRPFQELQNHISTTNGRNESIYFHGYLRSWLFEVTGRDGMLLFW